MSDQPDLLDTKQSAQVLGLKPQTLEAWRLRGKHLQFLKLGSRVFYQRAELDRFIAQSVRSSTSQTGA